MLASSSVVFYQANLIISRNRWYRGCAERTRGFALVAAAHDYFYHSTLLPSREGSLLARASTEQHSHLSRGVCQ